MLCQPEHEIVAALLWLDYTVHDRLPIDLSEAGFGRESVALMSQGDIRTLADAFQVEKLLRTIHRRVQAEARRLKAVPAPARNDVTHLQSAAVVAATGWSQVLDPGQGASATHLAEQIRRLCVGIVARHDSDRDAEILDRLRSNRKAVLG